MKIFIGYDNREDEAYKACKNSLLQNSVKVKSNNIIPLNLLVLQGNNWYFRQSEYPDEVKATDFAFSRFLVPFLNGYEGWAVFCDCDFIFTRDVQGVFDLADDKYAVMCVQHNYTCKDTVKMDNQKQIPFPRKNWSSMMLFNCSHPDCKMLNPHSVSTKSAAWLHQMQWTSDDNIGSLPIEWNWLVGEYNKNSLNGQTPAVLHYTLGCPFMEGYENCDFADEYYKYAK